MDSPKSASASGQDGLGRICRDGWALTFTKVCRGGSSASPHQQGGGTQVQETLLQPWEWEGEGPRMCLGGSLNTAGEEMGT